MKEMCVSDPSSFSRPELAKVTDLELNLIVDFPKKFFKGNAKLVVCTVSDTVREVILDTKDLHIFKIYETELNEQLNYKFDEPIKEYGSKLTIYLPEKTSNMYCIIKLDKDFRSVLQSHYEICIDYKTNSNATGLHWLEPQQTSGKQYPYVFSQFQPIHARSFLPCQDSPAVKTPYKASITAPNPFTILMSAICINKTVISNNTTVDFVQKIPIPFCLIAIAIGKIESRKISHRSTIWAENEIINQAASEFSETEKLLQEAEKICGPYVWEIYDMLILPPSFPLGGMENPCLTFFTPTMLGGGKFITDGIAHEIVHSWSGNLVTNRNFEHFWLNEAFTVFIERRIIGRIMSKEEEDFDAYCGEIDLKESISFLGIHNPITSLVVDLKQTYPDDAYTIVPYEKGYIFLRVLEEVVGGPAEFEPFLYEYFKEFKFKSIDSNDLKSFFESYFSKNINIKKIDWNIWLYASGMPIEIPKYDQTLLNQCIAYKNLWLNWDMLEEIPLKKEEVRKLTPQQIVQILQEILEDDPQSIQKLIAIEQVFEFNISQNCDIKFKWLRIGLKARWEEKIDEAITWLNVIGRLKFIRPLYRDLYDWEKAREKAIVNFKNNCHKMMHVSAYTVRQDLHLTC